MFLQTAFISDQCVCVHVCVTVVATVPAAEAGVLLVRGTYKGRLWILQTALCSFYFPPYSSAGNHGYGGGGGEGGA